MGFLKNRRGSFSSSEKQTIMRFIFWNIYMCSNGLFYVGLAALLFGLLFMRDEFFSSLEYPVIMGLAVVLGYIGRRFLR